MAIVTPVLAYVGMQFLPSEIATPELLASVSSLVGGYLVYLIANKE